MKASMTFGFGLVLVACWINPAPGQDQGADEALKLAKKLTEEGAATFNKADAKAMAAYYTADAKVFFQTQ